MRTCLLSFFVLFIVFLSGCSSANAPAVEKYEAFSITVSPGDVITSLGDMYTDEVYFGGYLGQQAIIYRGGPGGIRIPFYYNVSEKDTIKLPYGNDYDVKVRIDNINYFNNSMTLVSSP